METPDPSNTQPPNSDSPADITQIFAEAETCLNNFKQEYAKIEAARQTARASRNFTAAVKAESELKKLEEKVEELEMELAGNVMSTVGDSVKRKLAVMGMQEEFWQFIRYAGLGFVLGVGVKFLIR
jgi:uncharacterized membrane protein